MSDSAFYKAFKENMEAMGLPAPNSLFSSLGLAFATTGAIASAIAKLGTEVTLAEIVLTIPWAGATRHIAAGLSEANAAVGALMASFYLGACIGSIIAAALDTYGPTIVGRLSIWLAQLGKKLKMSLADFMDDALYDFPDLAPIRESCAQVRSMGGYA